MSPRHRAATRERVAQALGLLYGVMWIGGIVAYLWRGGVAAHEAWTAPAFLLLASVIVLVAAAPRERLALLAAAAVGFAAECAGVRYAWPFGAYSYTDRLFPSVYGVPVVMASAWLVLVAYVRGRVPFAAGAPAGQVLLSAIWITAIDLVIDPVAAGPLAYWTWTDGGSYYGVPGRNFAGWFAVGGVAFGLAAALDQPSSGTTALAGGAAPPSGAGRRTARFVGLSIVLFFTILAASFGLRLPALAGLLLCVADVVISARQDHEHHPGPD